MNFEGLTLTELKDMAKSRNIKGYHKMKKDELIKSLRKQRMNNPLFLSLIRKANKQFEIPLYFRPYR